MTRWFQSLDADKRARVDGSTFGAMPAVERQPLSVAGGPLWHWWAMAVLPLDQRNKLMMLSMTSLHARLHALQRVLRFLEQQRS